MRVFVGVLATETNTFSPIPTGIGSFRRPGAYYPAGQHPQHQTEFGAPFLVTREWAERLGWQLVEGMMGHAQPGGPITAPAWQELSEEFLAPLRASPPLDMVILGLHGAMVAEDCEDCEGYLLAEIRKIVGSKCIIGVVMDPHCHMTEEMRSNADILIAFKCYPHTDIAERTEDLVRLCAETAAGKLAPASTLLDLEMVSLVFTSYGPGKEILETMFDLETQPGVLSVSLVQGFPWADVSHMGSRVLVYTDGDQLLAETTAKILGDKLIAVRDQLAAPKLQLDDALDETIANPASPIIIAESADNAGGGAASDSTFVLQRLLERNVANAVIGPLWDPVAVQFAFLAGEGAVLPLRVGGKVGPNSGNPVDANFRVLALKAGMTMTSLSGAAYQLGDCALVETGGIEVVLTSLRAQALNVDLFTGLGCDLERKKLIFVKSTQHFYSSFSKLSENILYITTPGTVTDDITRIEYKNIKRPKWPIFSK